MDEAWHGLAGRTLLVLGAGYVGAAVARSALAAGLRVAALTRGAASAAALRDSLPGIEAWAGDVVAGGWEAELEEPPAAVVFTAAPGGSGVEAYRRLYVEGLRRAVAALAGWPGGTIVYTSSTGVYPQDGDVEVDEDASLAGARPTGAVLREAEEVLAAGAEAAGWRWFALRLAGLYGPDRHLWLDRVRAGGPFAGNPDHRLNLVHRDDAAAAVARAAAAPVGLASGVYNVADGRPGTRGELVTWLAQRLGRPPPQWQVLDSPGERGPVPNRRIVAERIRRDLAWEPGFPDWRAGYAALLRAAGQDG
jgi:nucleoside-diphosphate-sugar epimerase